METKSKLKKNIVSLLVLTLSGSFIYTLPYFRSYYYSAFMDAFGMTNTQMGLCGTVFGLVGSVSYLFGGVIVDYFSARKLIPISMLMTGTLGLALLSSPPAYIIVLIHGLWGITALMTFWPALMKCIRALAASNEQGKAFGIFEGGRGIFNAGYLAIAAAIFGKMIAAGSEKMGVRWIIIFYSVMTIGLGLLNIYLLRDMEDESDKKEAFEFKTIIKPLKMPEIWLMIGIIFSTLTVSTGYYYISPYATKILGASAMLGVILTSSSQYVRPVASFFAGVLGDKINGSKVMLIGQAGLVAGLVIILCSQSTMGIVPIIIGGIIVFASMYICVSMHFAIMVEIDCPAKCEGAAIGLICCLGYLPEATSPFIAGKLLDQFPGALGYQLFFIYMLAVVIFGIILTLIWFRRTKEKRMRILKNNRK
ncbi:MFS transporter [Hespellia stercorisuis]|uniref:Sugar phosphate permease n=1 Tax=Hespellia stercorisuis DSM 15480 TaxID=1121950 RepID=A0A1M6U5L3_9FIRM|nr:MFS transporter [Hespellia stercorisuis]SHK64487.1 Sugar phosphate permease [Hespellia stercorisuis DSM 15480]